MIKRLIIYIALIPTINYAQLTVINPGLEGSAGACFVTPSPWENCMPFTNFINGNIEFTTPDTQPGCYNINLAPSEGNSYIGFGHIPDYDLLNPNVGATEWQEGFSQELSSPMIANDCPYTFTIDLANGLTADPWNGTDIATTIGEVKIFGGFDFCSEEELLWSSGPITNENWETYTVEFTPNDNYTHILFQCVKTEEKALCAYILADNITPIINTDPISNAGSDQSICENSTILNANTIQNEEIGTWIVISGNGIFQDANNPNSLVSDLSLEENIFAWVVSSKCTEETGFSEVIINVSQEPVANAGADQSICENSTFLNGNITQNQETGTWTIITGSGVIENPNDPNTNVSNLSLGENILQWTISSDLCNDITDETSIIVEILELTIEDISNYNGYDISCASYEDGYIEVLTTGGYPPYNYNWIGPNNFSSNNQNIYNLDAGLYECVVIDNLDCQRMISIEINEPEPIEIELIGFNDMNCFNSPYIDFNVTGGTGTLEGIINTSWGETTTFTWNTANEWYFQYENFNQWDGEINVTAIDANNCSSVSENISITTWEDPIAEFNISSYNASTSDLILFNDNSYSEAPIINWTWDFGDGNISNNPNPIHIYEEENQYTVCLNIQDENGCESQNCQIINIYNNSHIYIPNIFTVNNDNINEVFLPIVYGLQENSYKMLIYDRWGKLLFSNNNHQIGWDGKYKGKLVTQDVYTYKISYLTISGDFKNYTGKLTLVK